MATETARRGRKAGTAVENTVVRKGRTRSERAEVTPAIEKRARAPKAGAAVENAVARKGRTRSERAEATPAIEKRARAPKAGAAVENPVVRKGRTRSERAEATPAIEERLRLPKAGELVARHLRNRIIRGELPERTMLPSEHDLIRQFGVSRPTLREAIRVLESEQLLEITRGLHGGARVLKPNIDVAARYFGFLLQASGIEVADVYRTRVAIEPAAVRILATERRPETVAALRACLDASDQATQNLENALAFSRFHRVIIEQTRVETLILLMAMLNTILDRYLLAVGAVFGQYVEADAETAKASRSRRKLVGYIEQGESDLAADLWRRYLQEAEVKLRKWQPTRLIVDLLQNE